MTVLAFGTFDPLHEGHMDFFRQARACVPSGERVRLVVVVARDSFIRSAKQRDPHQPEDVRLARVANVVEVDEALLGDEWPAPDRYRLLRDLSFDIVVLGYDQHYSQKAVQRQLAAFGKTTVRVVRLDAYRPERFKSSQYH